MEGVSVNKPDSPDEMTTKRIEKARDQLLEQLMDPTVTRASLNSLTPKVGEAIQKLFEESGWQVKLHIVQRGEDPPYGDGTKWKDASITIVVENEGSDKNKPSKQL